MEEFQQPSRAFDGEIVSVGLLRSRDQAPAVVHCFKDDPQFDAVSVASSATLVHQSIVSKLSSPNVANPSSENIAGLQVFRVPEAVSVSPPGFLSRHLFLSVFLI